MPSIALLWMLLRILAPSAPERFAPVARTADSIVRALGGLCAPVRPSECAMPFTGAAGMGHTPEVAPRRPLCNGSGAGARSARSLSLRAFAGGLTTADATPEARVDHTSRKVASSGRMRVCLPIPPPLG